MKFKKIMMLAILLVSLFTISAVSAADNVTGDVVGMDDATVKIAIEETNLDENLKNSDECTISATHTVSGNSWKDIQNAIDNARDGDTIEISGEYTGGAILVNKTVNIVGKGDATLNVGSWTAFDISAKNVNISNLKIFDGSMSIKNYGNDLNFRCIDCLFDGMGVYGSGLFIGCNFTNCKYAINGDSSAINCNFINNGIAEYGSPNKYAIYSQGEFDFSIINCTFINNIGGAISQYGENGLSIINCTFINNTADEGGAIHIGSNENRVKIIGCNFTGNRAEYGYGGGAIYSWGNIYELSDCLFIDNCANENGGAVYSFGDDNVAVGCIFINNTCENDGGAMDGCDAMGCTFTGNSASCGGALYYANAIDSIFADNRAEFNGGAMYYGNANGCEFISNSAYNGGSICDGSAVNCSFTNNTAGNFGGAVDISSRISNSVFMGNYAKNGGAVSRVSGISNSRFEGNYAYDYGGAIYSDRDMDITLSEFVRNFANGNGGAIYAISSIRDFRDYSDWSTPITIEDYDDLVKESSYEINIGDGTRFVGNFAINGGAIFVEKNDNLDIDVVNIFAGKLCLGANVMFEENIAGDVWSIATADAILRASPDFKNDEYPILGGSSPEFYGGYGGALYLSDTQFVIDGVAFDSNCAMGDGGAIYVRHLLVDATETEGGKSFEYALYDVEFRKNIVSLLQLEEQSAGRYVLRLKDPSPNNISGAVSMDGKTVTVSFGSSYGGNGLVRVVSQSGDVLKDFESTFVNGKTQFNMDLLKRSKFPGGNHTVVICYAKNEEACFKLPLAVESKLAFEASDVYYGESERVTFTLTDNGQAIGGATIKIMVAGISKIVKTDANGRVVIEFNLPVGTYDVVTHYDDYVIDSKFTVKSTISVANTTGEFMNAKTSATFLNTDGKALASRQVTFKVGDKTYTATTNSKGVATADVDLGVGTYTVTAINPVNREQKQFNLVIGKANSAIALASSQNNDVIALTVTLTPVATTGNVIFNINGEDKSAPIRNAKATITLSDLNPGDYYVTARYDGDKNLKASASNAVTFNVAEVYPILTADPVTKTYGTSTKLVVNLVDSKGNAIANADVNVDINGQVTPITTDSSGQATMSINKAPGSYTAAIAYADAQTTAKITVKKATPKLTAKAKTFKKSVKTKKYTITLKTNTNKVMKNTKVTLKVNGKTYSAKTNAKGQATFKITKLTKKGKFTAVVKFAGNKYYNAKTVKPKITVK